MSDGTASAESERGRSAERGRSSRVGSSTRLRYLRAAAELAASSSPGQDTFPYAVSRVTMADAAAELGVARTTLYKLWASKLDFWSDLTTYIATTERGPSPADIAAAILAGAPGASAPQSILDHGRVVLNALQANQLVNPWVAMRTALLAYAGDARIDRLVAAANARDIGEIEAQVELMLFGLGVAPREPLTARDIAVVAFCIADGFAVAGRLTPRVNAHDIALDGGPPEWGLVAFALQGIVRRCTRPRTAADPEPRLDSPPPEAVADATARWTPAQRAALAAGARRFMAPDAAEPPGRPSGPLGHVTLARLARHTGVSRQSLHRVWPSQRAFAADLITHLFEERCEDVLRTMRHAIRSSMEVAVGGALVATERAMVDLHRFAARGPQAHLASASHGDDPSIRRRCEAAVESMLDRFAADLAALTQSWGGSTREGVTFFHLAAIIVQTELSAARLERVNPGSLRLRLPHRGGEWSALAIMIEGIVAYSLGLPIEDAPAVVTRGQAL